MNIPGFITRNFKLKLACTVMAMITWVGVVYAGNPPQTRTVTVHVPQATSLIPAQYVLVNPVPDLNVRIGGPRDSLAAFKTSSLAVNVNWKAVNRPGSTTVPVTVTNTDLTVELIDPPTSITADVDTLDSATLPVNIVITNPPPQGYVTSSESSSPASVVVAGPHNQLAGLQARATVDLGNRKTNVQADVPVLVYDQRGAQVSDVSTTPAIVQITVAVSASQTSRASAVVPRTTGSVAAGHELAGIRVSPATVVLSGPQDLLNALDSIQTSTISLNGLTGNVSVTVSLTPPAGVTAGPDSVTVTISVVSLPAPTAAPTPTPTPAPSPTQQ
ncbi:MAG: YbbR-like domain-containing protein [Candidatus Dormibacteria bacterium]